MAEQSYCASVDAQRAADATGIPCLSAAAEAATSAVATASDENTRAAAWRSVQQDKQVAAELRTFGAAVTQRFGEEAVRAMLRARGQPGAVTAPSVAAEQRPAMDRLAGLTVALKAGERTGANLAEREAERQGQRRGMRM